MRTTCKIFILLTALFALSFSSLAVAQSPDPDPTPTQKEVPYPSTEGVDFWLTFLRNHGGSTDKDATVVLAVWVSSIDGAPVGIYDSNSNLLTTLNIPAGGAVYYELPNAAKTYYPNDKGVVPSAVHVVSMDTVSRFSCAGFSTRGESPKMTSDMALALPTNALKYEYVVQTFVHEHDATEFAIVITEDNTNLQVNPTQPLKVPVPAGPFKKGQVIFAESNQPETGKVVDLSGTTICADKPIAVFVGNQQGMAPRAMGGYDGGHTYEEITPISNWGKKFYVSMVDAPDIKLNNFLITGYTAGNVKVEYNNGTFKTYPVDLGSVLEANNSALSFDVAQGITNAVVTSDVPIAVFNYMTLPGINQSPYYEARGNVVSAFIPSWDQAVSEMSFVTQSMDPEVDTDKYYRAQITAKKSDIGSIKIVDSNGNTYGFVKQTPFADNQMVTAVSEDLPADRGFVISGAKFVGYVYSISAAQANLHPLGFNPYMNEDSLFVKGALSMQAGYPYLEMPQGWYHRQFRDFPTNIKPRLDTAAVCDKTPLEFVTQLGETATVDEMEFTIFPLDEKGKQMAEPVDEPVVRPNPTDVLQTFSHTFDLENDYPDIDLDNPRPYYYFKTQTVIKHSRLLCTDMDPIIDTLMSVVRVSFQYNDTTYRMLCMGDTLEFFNDSFPRQNDLYREANPIKHSSTKFVAYKGNKPAICDKDFYYGVNVADVKPISATDPRKGVIFSRTYQSSIGCDSISTIVIYVCDTFYTRVADMILTHDHPSIKFPNVENTMFRGKTISKPGIYLDTLKTTNCPSCSGFDYKEFEGCDSIIELRVHLRDTLRAEFCDSVYTMDAFGESPVHMDWGGYTWLNHLKDKNGNDLRVYRVEGTGDHWVWSKDLDHEFTKGLTKPETLTFRDSYKICNNVDSNYVLILTCNPSFSDYRELVICEDSVENWPGRYQIDENGQKVPFKVTGPAVPDNTTKTFYKADQRKTIHGCDSVYFIKLKVYPTYNKTLNTIYRCKSEVDQGNPYIWTDEKGVEHRETKTGDYGARYPLKQFPECDCDSAFTIHFEVVNDNPLDTTVHVCRTDPPFEIKDLGITFNPSDSLSADYTKSVIKVDLHDFVSLPNVTCKREEDWHIYVHQTYDNIETVDTVCQADDVYYWEKHTGMMDNRQIWSVEQKKRISASAISISEVEQGSELYQIFHYIDTIPGGSKGWKDREGHMHGCDSIHTLTLYVAKTYNDDLGTAITDHQTLCDIDTLRWGATLFVGEHFEGTLPSGITTQIVESKKSPYADEYTFQTWFSTQSDKIECDSLVHLTLTVMPSVSLTLEDFTCMSDDHAAKPYYYRYYNNGEGGDLDISYAHDIERMDTIPSLTPELSCDTVVSFTLHVLQTYITNNVKYDTICMDAPYDWAEIRDEKKGTDDLSDGHVYFRGEVVKDIYTHIDDDQLLSETLVFYDSLLTAGGKGCDSIHVLQLFVPRSYHIYDTLKVAIDDTLRWHEKFYVGCDFPGQLKPEDEQKAIPVCLADDQEMTTRDDDIPGTRYYHEFLRDEKHTCDSIHYLHLLIGKNYRDTTYDYVCDNCEYEWVVKSPTTGNDTTIYCTSPNKVITYYYDTLKTVLGFDSIFVLSLKGYPTYHYQAADTICQGETNDPDSPVPGPIYHWAKHELTTSNLFINGVHVTSIPTDVWGDIVIYDSLKTDTTFIDPHRPTEIQRVHCDSVYTLNLYVAPSFNTIYNTFEATDPHTICSNDTIVWEHTLIMGPDYDSITFPLPNKLDGVYDSVIHTTIEHRKAQRYTYQRLDTTRLGCDSIRFLDLTINLTIINDKKEILPDNNTTWTFGSGLGRGDYSTAADYHLPSEKYPHSDYTQYRDPYWVYLVDTVPNPDTGCDQITRDSVIVVPSYHFVLDTTVCSNDDWSWRKYEHVSKMQSGTYFDRLTTETYLADSIYQLNLTIIPNFQRDEHYNICKNDTFPWEYYYIYFHPGDDDPNKEISYTVEYESVTGCPAYATLYPHFYNYYHYKVDIDTICQFDIVDWPGREGHTQHAYRDQMGRPLDALPADTTGWIVIYDSLHTTAPCACDSTYTLYRFVKPAFHDTTFATICSDQVYEWRGKEYSSTEATTIYDQEDYLNVYDCDSIYFLVLQVDQMYLYPDYDTICADKVSEYEWYDSFAGKHHLIHLPTLDEALVWDHDTIFSFSESYSTVLGCDSIHTLDLVIHPVLRTYLTDSICYADTLDYLGHKIWQAGIYVDTLSTIYGCDSIVTLDLSVIPPTHFQISIPRVCANEPYFEIPFTYDADKPAPIAYSLYFEDLALEQGFANVIDEPIDVTESMSIIVTMPPYSADDYPDPYDYHVAIQFDNGYCLNRDSLTVPFILDLHYPSFVIEQHWNDVIGILVPALNGGYSFTSYQWYRNDSIMVGETGPYLYQPHLLDPEATYSVALTRVGDSIAYLTCPITPVMMYDELKPTLPYIDVVPNCVVRQNPIVNILAVNPGSYRLFDAFGTLITTGAFTPDEHHAYEVRMPDTSGLYLFELRENSGLTRTVKVLVQ